MAHETRDALKEGIETIAEWTEALWPLRYILIDESHAEEGAFHLSQFHGGAIEVFYCTVHTYRTFMRRYGE